MNLLQYKPSDVDAVAALARAHGDRSRAYTAALRRQKSAEIDGASDALFLFGVADDISRYCCSSHITRAAQAVSDSALTGALKETW